MGVDAVLEPPALDRELLDRNLEGERAKGLTCPCCQKVNQWALGPKTRTEILDIVLRPGVDGIHEKFIRCQNAACPSFLRRITAGQDGALKVETISLDNMLVDLRYARAMAQVANQHARGVDAKRLELEGIRADLQRRLDEVQAQTEQGKGAAEEVARLRQDAADLNSWLKTIASKLGFADPVDHEGLIKRLDEIFAQAQILEDIARLGNTTQIALLEKAEAFAAKHRRK